MCKRLANEQQPRVKQDLEILVQALEDGIERSAIQHANLQPYYNAQQLLFFSFTNLLDPRNDPERYPQALVRLSRYTGTAKGYEPITELASANVEGWGLYAESIMQEYLPLEGQLFNLFTRLMRAARMFMDPMINTGQMSHRQAVALMTEQMALSAPMANSEADRYSFRAPGQATSYYYGYMSLMALRT